MSYTGEGDSLLTVPRAARASPPRTAASRCCGTGKERLLVPGRRLGVQADSLLVSPQLHPLSEMGWGLLQPGVFRVPGQEGKVVITHRATWVRADTCFSYCSVRRGRWGRGFTLGLCVT